MLLMPMIAWAQEDVAVQYVGRPVTEILESFREQGVNFAYSTNLLTPDLLVQSEPEPGAPLEIALQILQPYGLTVRTEADVYLVVREARDVASSGSSVQNQARPETVQPDLEAIAGTARRYEILRDISTSRLARWHSLAWKPPVEDSID